MIRTFLAEFILSKWFVGCMGFLLASLAASKYPGVRVFDLTIGEACIVFLAVLCVVIIVHKPKTHD